MIGTLTMGSGHELRAGDRVKIGRRTMIVTSVTSTTADVRPRTWREATVDLLRGIWSSVVAAARKTSALQTTQIDAAKK